jgi:hypothetical protein
MDKPSLPWIGGALVIAGLIWIGQGLGFIGGSPMTDEPFWAAMGVLLVAGGASLIYGWRAARRRSGD